MRKCVLTQAAKSDMVAIAKYGDEFFGAKKSDQYRDKLEHRLLLPANNPYHYPAVDHIHKGYRRSVCGVHSIYYKTENNGIAIIRILGMQNPGQAF